MYACRLQCALCTPTVEYIVCTYIHCNIYEPGVLKKPSSPLSLQTKISKIAKFKLGKSFPFAKVPQRTKFVCARMARSTWLHVCTVPYHVHVHVRSQLRMYACIFERIFRMCVCICKYGFDSCMMGFTSRPFICKPGAAKRLIFEHAQLGELKAQFFFFLSFSLSWIDDDDVAQISRSCERMSVPNEDLQQTRAKLIIAVSVFSAERRKYATNFSDTNIMIGIEVVANNRSQPKRER